MREIDYLDGVLDTINLVRQYESQGADDIADYIIDYFCTCKMGADNMDLLICPLHERLTEEEK